MKERCGSEKGCWFVHLCMDELGTSIIFKAAVLLFAESEQYLPSRQPTQHSALETSRGSALCLDGCLRVLLQRHPAEAMKQPLLALCLA